MGIGEIAALVAGVVVLYFVCRVLTLPLRLTMKLVYNGILGGIGLWLANMLGALVSVTVPITVVTALVAGFLGLPGVLGIFVWYGLLNH